MRLDRDVGLAAAVAAIGQLDIWVTGTIAGPPAITVPASLLLALAIAFRRRAPLVAVAVGLVALVGQDLLAEPAEGLSTILAVIVLAYSAGAELRTPLALVAGATILATFWAAAALGGPAEAGDYVFTALIAAAPWLIGRASRRAERDRRARLAADRRRHAEEVVAGERERIARELHDVVAHSVSVMVVHAGALRQLADAPEQVDGLRAIETSGRQAMAELRRMLVVLRGAEPHEASPQPGLEDLRPLVDRVRDAGLDVALTVDATAGPGAGLAVYRVVQEALTNVLKHGRDVTRATVTVTRLRDVLSVEVDDDGAEATESVGGHGLVGMRERAELYGGSLTAGPKPGGGWRIRATFGRAADLAG